MCPEVADGDQAAFAGKVHAVGAQGALLVEAAGPSSKDEDVARLSPLKDRHINFPGRYLFNIAASGPAQGLRPLRDPDATDVDDEDAEGWVPVSQLVIR